mmetsp:Transcript_14232/g.12551  ORF Transcript_14232/g.12551 Transcript_14232/m.12551 type:complete len:143 (+) Transcript_14232:230-658(+)
MREEEIKSITNHTTTSNFMSDSLEWSGSQSNNESESSYGWKESNQSDWSQVSHSSTGRGRGRGGRGRGDRGRGGRGRGGRGDHKERGRGSRGSRGAYRGNRGGKGRSSKNKNPSDWNNPPGYSNSSNKRSNHSSDDEWGAKS